MAALIQEQLKVRKEIILPKKRKSHLTNRVIAKQCYHCQGLGHVQADCPTLRLNGTQSGGRCYSCGQLGHLAVRPPYPIPSY
jgi:hypothetical protein